MDQNLINILEGMIRVSEGQIKHNHGLPGDNKDSKACGFVEAAKDCVYELTYPQPEPIPLSERPGARIYYGKSKEHMPGLISKFVILAERDGITLSNEGTRKETHFVQTKDIRELVDALLDAEDAIIDYQRTGTIKGRRT